MDRLWLKPSDSRLIKLLIVEDEPDYAAALGIIFMAFGYEVLMAYNGEEAIDKARRELPDLILMDITMPRMNGFEACRIIRSAYSTKDIPIVALSASASPKDKEEALNLGIDEYVVKPFEQQALLATVRRLLESKKTRISADSHIFSKGREGRNNLPKTQ